MSDTEPQRICNRCQAVNKIEANFCARCGASLGSEKRVSPAKLEKVVLIVICAVVCLFFVLIWVLSVATTPTSPPQATATRALTRVAQPLTLSAAQMNGVKNQAKSASTLAMLTVFGKNALHSRYGKVAALLGVNVSVTTQRRTVVIDSNLLVIANNCQTAEKIPYQMTVGLQLASVFTANIAGWVFLDVKKASELQITFSNLMRNKYGHEEMVKEFVVEVSRQQSDRMNWDWFEEAAFEGTIDPSALDKFDFVIPGLAPGSDSRDIILSVIRENWEQSMSSYGLPYEADKAARAAIQMANSTNCSIY